MDVLVNTSSFPSTVGWVLLLANRRRVFALLLCFPSACRTWRQRTPRSEDTGWRRARRCSAIVMPSIVTNASGIARRVPPGEILASGRQIALCEDVQPGLHALRRGPSVLRREPLRPRRGLALCGQDTAQVPPGAAGGRSVFGGRSLRPVRNSPSLRTESDPAVADRARGTGDLTPKQTRRSRSMTPQATPAMCEPPNGG